MTGLELIGVGAKAREVWGEILPHDPDALISQTPTWMDCVCEVGGFEDATRAYRTADQARLVLPLARRRIVGRPTTAYSMPFGWGTGGILSSRGRLLSEDVAGVVADLRTQRELVLGVRPSAGASPAWVPAVPAGVVCTAHMSQTVDLRGGFDAVWKQRIAATVRSHCRKAERRGVTIERDDTGRLIHVFNDLYRVSVQRWSAAQHEPLWLARLRADRRDPPRKFETVARRLGADCRVWVAWRAGQPLAALVVLVHGEHSHMWRAAMDKEAIRGTGAGELLHIQAFQEACAQGHRFFHLGDSAPGSALAANKRKFGGGERSYHGYRFERLPVTAVDRRLRRGVKRVIGFRD